MWRTLTSRLAGCPDSRDLAQGDDRRDRRRVHGPAQLVDDEAAVGVAVEREAEVGAVLDDRALQVDEVGRFERVRLVVGERAVELEVERHDLERQHGQAGRLAEHGRHRQPAHSVSGVDDDLQRPDVTQVDERSKVGGVVGEHVDLGDRTGLGHGLTMPCSR